MSATVLYMSISPDGFMTGPNELLQNGLGVGGERLHEHLAFGGGAPGEPFIHMRLRRRGVAPAR
jgi:hypothetical protein